MLREYADQWMNVFHEACQVPYDLDARPPIRSILEALNFKRLGDLVSPASPRYGKLVAFAERDRPPTQGNALQGTDRMCS